MREERKNRGGRHIDETRGDSFPLSFDSRHTLQRTLAAGNKLPLEISESLLRGARDRVVARNNFIVFLRWYRGRDRVVPDGPEGNRAWKATREFECADDISLCRRGRTEERRC